MPPSMSNYHLSVDIQLQPLCPCSAPISPSMSSPHTRKRMHSAAARSWSTEIPAAHVGGVTFSPLRLLHFHEALPSPSLLSAVAKRDQKAGKKEAVYVISSTLPSLSDGPCNTTRLMQRYNTSSRGRAASPYIERTIGWLFNKVKRAPASHSYKTEDFIK